MDAKRDQNLGPKSPEKEPQQKAAPPGVPAARAVTPSVTEEKAMPLLPDQETKDLRTRWDTVQVGFVDDPRQAVEQADALVGTVMKRLTETFTEERKKLESQWHSGGDVSTEDLRVALRRYRSFFSRLLSI